MEARERTLTNLQLLREKLGSEGMSSARMLIGSLHPSEVARLLESLPLHERTVIWEMVDPENEGDVLVEVNEEVRDGLIKGWTRTKLSLLQKAWNWMIWQIWSPTCQKL